MGTLSLPNDADPKDRRRVNEETGKRYCLTSHYSNQSALRDLIYYVMDPIDPETGEAEEFIGYGTLGAPSYGDTEQIIDSFSYIQYVNNIDNRGGRRVYHEILFLSDDEMKQYEITHNDLMNIGFLCGKVYEELGFQVLFAVHWNVDDGYHIHFVVNSISYLNGSKWHYDPDGLGSREYYFNALINDYLNRGRYVS